MHTSGLDYRRWRGVFRSRIKESLLGLRNREDASIESKGPVFTFTFDDAPSSAYSTGANILENAGCNGTFFYAGSTSKQRHLRSCLLYKPWICLNEGTQ